MAGHPEDTEDFVRRISELPQVSIPLRVAKAIPSDVGLGRVRVPLHLCPSLSAGDIVKIIPQDCAEGSKSTQGMPARLAAAAVARHMFDCTPAVVTTALHVVREL